MEQKSLLTAKQAASLLGLKPATLYSYVSRGVLRCYGRNDKRESLYAVEEVEHLLRQQQARRGEGAAGAQYLQWGRPVLESAITKITPEGPVYRGYLASRLADSVVSLESVAELLWAGVLPENLYCWKLSPCTTLDGISREAMGDDFGDPHLRILKVFNYLTAKMGLDATTVQSQTLDESIRLARQLIYHLADGTKVLACQTTGRNKADQSAQNAEMSLAERLAWRLGCSNPLGYRLINTAMILCADHELTASTFAARIAASTGADLLSCHSTALGVLAGPRHGLTFPTIERAFDAVTQSRSFDPMVIGDGFQHYLYPKGDPRGRLLYDKVRSMGVKDDHLQVICDAIERTSKNLHSEPTVDLALVLMCRALGLPAGSAAALFAIARIVGLTAHILEQRASGFMVRPRAKYVGR